MPSAPGPEGLSGWPFMSWLAPASQTPSTSVQVSAPYQASECGTVTHGVAWPSTVYAPLDISRYMLRMVLPRRLMPRRPSGPRRSGRTRSVTPCLV
jgi:hypothetical protein